MDLIKIGWHPLILSPDWLNRRTLVPKKRIGTRNGIEAGDPIPWPVARLQVSYVAPGSRDTFNGASRLL